MSKVKQNFSAQRRIIKDLVGFIFFQHHAAAYGLFGITYLTPRNALRKK